MSEDCAMLNAILSQTEKKTVRYGQAALAQPIKEKTMTTEQQLKAILVKLQSIQADLAAVDYTPSECSNQKLGEHLFAASNHFDNLCGRLSTVIDHVRHPR